MGTVIKIIPPNGVKETIKAYESCNVNLSITERAGSFSITLPFLRGSDISKYVVGTDVEITQDDNVFRGWVIKPPKKLNGPIKTITLEGADYTAKTQRIVATESYTDTNASDIVIDLFSKYVPWASIANIFECPKIMTITFPDVYLWDAMEQICKLTNCEWFIDENLAVNFFETATNMNTNVISEADNNYKRGTAQFTEDASKLVNKLWIKGAKAISLPYTQNITISGNNPIPLYYKPRSDGQGIIVKVGGVQKTLGIQNINDEHTCDFLINYNEKLLVPDLCVSGIGIINYCYEYPIKFILEDKLSQQQYGLFEDILSVDTQDKDLARELGSRYLNKYSKPILQGSIEPHRALYKPGELLKIEIPSLDIDDYLVIKSVNYESVPSLGVVNRKVQLEAPERDVGSILKTINSRLSKIEKVVFNEAVDQLIERYNLFADAIISPQLFDLGVIYDLHQYKLCGQVVCGNVVI